MINRQRLIDEFLQLVQTDSETGDERAICDLLKMKLEHLGLHVVEDDSATFTKHGAGNLIATFPGSISDSPIIHFTSHMDTVAPGKNIKPRRKGDYIVTDGTTILGSDDKAGIAAIIEGIRNIQEEKIPHGTIQIIFTVGEESRLIGSRHIDRSLLKADYGYAFDSDGKVGEVVIGGPSQMTIEASVHGKAAHAGACPEKGISAIQVASQAISQMKLGRIDHETTANIGKFAGGVATNVIPEHVRILAEARSLNKEKLDRQVNSMVEAFRSSAEKLGAVADVETKLMYPGFLFTENDHHVIKAMNSLKRIGREPHLVYGGGGSDANVFSGYGIPTINLGVGYENMHTVNERMPIRELIKSAELFVSIVQECVR